MLRPYDLLENVLIDIEKGIRDGINQPNLLVIANNFNVLWYSGLRQKIKNITKKEKISTFMKSKITSKGKKNIWIRRRFA